MYGSFRYEPIFHNSKITVLSIYSGMAKKYAALHLGDYTDEELSKARTMAERIQSKLHI